MERGLTSSGSVCSCLGEGLEGSDGAGVVGEAFSDMGFEEVGVVVGRLTVVGISGVGVGIVGIPPARLNPVRVAVQSLFWSCCLRYAASASEGTIAGIYGVGVG